MPDGVPQVELGASRAPGYFDYDDCGRNVKLFAPAATCPPKLKWRPPGVSRQKGGLGRSFAPLWQDFARTDIKEAVCSSQDAWAVAEFLRTHEAPPIEPALEKEIDAVLHSSGHLLGNGDGFDVISDDPGPSAG